MGMGARSFGLVYREPTTGNSAHIISTHASLTQISQVTPPELLPKGKSNAVCLPYNLFDRVLAAAGRGDEIEETLVQQKAKVLRKEVLRRLEALESFDMK